MSDINLLEALVHAHMVLIMPPCRGVRAGHGDFVGVGVSLFNQGGRFASATRSLPPALADHPLAAAHGAGNPGAGASSSKCDARGERFSKRVAQLRTTLLETAEHLPARSVTTLLAASNRRVPAAAAKRDSRGIHEGGTINGRGCVMPASCPHSFAQLHTAS